MLTDGKLYTFRYVNAEGNERTIDFGSYPEYYDTTPAVAGVFRVTEVKDDRRPSHASVEAHGSCDTSGGIIRCAVAGDLGEYVIAYRIISETEHVICPPPHDVPHAIGDACAITYDAATAKKHRPWDKWEQTQWTATCETFQTPWAGAVPCNKASAEFTITSTYNDGSASFSFRYDNEQIFFTTRAPVEPGVYPIEEVQDEVRYPAETHGSCDMRGGKIRCVSGDPGKQIIIAYRLISQKHTLCPPPGITAQSLEEMQAEKKAAPPEKPDLCVYD